MAEKFKFVIDIDEEGRPIIRGVEGDIDRLERSSQRAGRGFRAMRINWLALTAAFAAGAYAVYRAVRGVLSLADAFGIQEAAENSLAVAMRNAGTYTEENIETMKQYAAELQKVTTYGDETTLSTMANLQAYGMSIDVLQKATKATMDLATAKKIDLRTAS
jgi:hypothetical protein